MSPSTTISSSSRHLWFACGAFFLVAVIGALATGQAVTDWDQGLLDLVASDRQASGVFAMRAVSSIGEGTIAIPLGIVLAFLVGRRRGAAVARCYLVTVLSGWAVSVLLKQVFQRPRPHILPRLGLAGGFSYPSGHAMLAPLVFGLAAVLLFPAGTRPWLRWSMVGLAGALCLGIGFARVYLAVHYPTDVIGAMLAGTGWATLGFVVYERSNAIARSEISRAAIP